MRSVRIGWVYQCQYRVWYWSQIRIPTLWLPSSSRYSHLNRSSWPKTRTRPVGSCSPTHVRISYVSCKFYNRPTCRGVQSGMFFTAVEFANKIVPLASIPPWLVSVEGNWNGATVYSLWMNGGEGRFWYIMEAEAKPAADRKARNRGNKSKSLKCLWWWTKQTAQISKLLVLVQSDLFHLSQVHRRERPPRLSNLQQGGCQRLEYECQYHH